MARKETGARSVGFSKPFFRSPWTTAKNGCVGLRCLWYRCCRAVLPSAHTARTWPLVVHMQPLPSLRVPASLLRFHRHAHGTLSHARMGVCVCVHVRGRGRRRAGRALLAALLATTATRPAAVAGLKFTFDADPATWQLWFNATRDACTPHDTPDESMTAFRRDDGTVVAFMGDSDRNFSDKGPIVGGFYCSHGPSVLNLTRDCSAPVLKSGGPTTGRACSRTTCG
jgi:hypothetical protein